MREGGTIVFIAQNYIDIAVGFELGIEEERQSLHVLCASTSH